ncbi:hypothetical protein KIPB_014565, partial [Kipferlia bialata]
RALPTELTARRLKIWMHETLR